VIWALAKRDLLSALRERRTLVLTLLLPLLLIPVLAYAPALLLGSTVSGGLRAAQPVAIQGAPKGLRKLLLAERLRPVNTPDPAQAVRERRFPAGLLVSGRSVTILGRLANEVSLSSLAVQKLRSALRAYRRELLRSALRQRGLPAGLLHPFALRVVDLSSPAARRAGPLAFLIPYFLLVFVQLGGMGVAIDGTAGEKERGTLEALLAAPVRRSQIALGKFTATWVMSALATLTGLLGLLLGGALLGLAGSATQLTGRLSLSLSSLLGLLVTALSFAALSSAVQVALALRSRSYKEAQSALAPLQLITLLPALLLELAGFLHPAAWWSALPVLNTLLSLERLILGRGQLGPLLLTWSTTLAYGALALRSALRSFQREEVLFRN
jgi:sodium transport system permease protein